VASVTTADSAAITPIARRLSARGLFNDAGVSWGVSTRSLSSDPRRLPTIDGTLTVDGPPGVGTVVTAGSRCWPAAGLTAPRQG
jgi:hypothetical protein